MVTPVNTTFTFTAAGALAGVFSAAGLGAAGVDWSIDFACLALAAGATARIAVEDSAAGDFSDALPIAVFHFVGPLAVAAQAFTLRSYDLATARVGTTNSKFRVNVLVVTGAPAGQVQCSVAT